MAKTQLFFLTKEGIASKWCLGLVSGSSGSRFCMGRRLPGTTHCGIKNHGSRGGSLRTKFQPQADCFYIPSGVVNSRPVVKKEPCLHWADVPSYDKNLFKNGMRKMAEWIKIFEERLNELEVAASELGVEEEEESMGQSSGASRPRYDCNASFAPEDFLREFADSATRE
jgi:hypothetical protein